MIRLSAHDRQRQQSLKAELRELERPAKEAEKRERKAAQKVRKANAPAKFEKRPKPMEDSGAAYMAWLHDDLPCIACVVLGKHTLPALSNPIEAAHQKMQVADRGWHRRAGRRGPHWTCVPLCAGHHRIGPLCCDPAQTKFWSVVGFEPEQVIDLAEALNAAFREGRSGGVVILLHAVLAAERQAA